MMKILFTIIILLGVFKTNVNAVTTKHSTDIHNDLDPVTDIRITEPDSNGKRRVLIRSRDLIAENTHELHLEEIAPVFAEDAVVEFSSGETKSAMDWASTSYLMKPSKSAGTTEWAMMRINKEGVLQGVFTIENGARLLQLDHVENFKDRMDENAHSRLLSEAVHSYVIHDTHETTLNPKYRRHLDSQDSDRCGTHITKNDTERLKARYAKYQRERSKRRKTQEQFEPQSITTLPSGYVQFWGDSSDPCYNLDTLTRDFKMGMAADHGFFKAAGATVDKTMAEIESIISSTRLVYLIQVNILLKLGKIVIADVVDANTPSPLRFDPAAGNCGVRSDTGAFLNVLETWNRNVNDANPANKMGHWHHLTNCWPAPGVVGVAYVGTICSGGLNIGITSRISASSTWQIYAHELGHGFGMSHSFENGQGQTGGIMDYGSPYYNGVIQLHPFKKPEICQEISTTLSCQFYTVSETSSTSGCGNGILDMSEQCECLNNSPSCTGCSNCTLTNPSQKCSSQIFVMRSTPEDFDAPFISATSSSLGDPICCTASGTFKEANTKCGTDLNDVCMGGKCVETCGAFGLITCASTYDNCRTPCKSPGEADSQCSDGWYVSGTGERIAFLPAGTSCRNGEGVCTASATCDAPTNSPTTKSPTTKAPTKSPTTKSPTTKAPTKSPTTKSPTTKAPTTGSPTKSPTTSSPTKSPTTKSPTKSPTTKTPTNAPVTVAPTTTSPTRTPTTKTPTKSPTTKGPTKSPTTKTPTRSPTTAAPTTFSPVTTAPTSSPVTTTPTQSPTTKSPVVPTRRRRRRNGRF